MKLSIRAHRWSALRSPLAVSPALAKEEAAPQAGCAAQAGGVCSLDSSPGKAGRLVTDATRTFYDFDGKDPGAAS